MKQSIAFLSEGAEVFPYEYTWELFGAVVWAHHRYDGTHSALSPNEVSVVALASHSAARQDSGVRARSNAWVHPVPSCYTGNLLRCP